MIPEMDGEEEPKPQLKEWITKFSLNDKKLSEELDKAM
jgi:hypothetical protein